MLTLSLRAGPALLAIALLAGAAPAIGDGGQVVNLWQPGDPGDRMVIRGRVTSLDGRPLPGVSIFIRQADGSGTYTERYSTVLVTDERGVYQFGSVVPGQYLGVKHVHVSISHDGYRWYDSRILFKGDPNLDESTAPEAIFLEEASVDGETIRYGRFDITLTPQ